MKLSNKMYDRLKFVAQILLPALALFYISVAPLWGFPKQEAVSGTVMALDLLLGTLLGISTKTYNDSASAFDGYLDSTGVDPDTGIPDLKMVITKAPDDILSGKEARLKIGPAPKQ